MQIQKTGSWVACKYHTKHSLTHFTLELAAGSVKVLTIFVTCPYQHRTDKQSKALIPKLKGSQTLWDKAAWHT